MKGVQPVEHDPVTRIDVTVSASLFLMCMKNVRSVEHIDVTFSAALVLICVKNVTAECQGGGYSLSWLTAIEHFLWR